MALDAERLRAHQTDLLSGEPAIRDEMARLEAVRDVCRTVAGRMRGTVEQGERNTIELRRKGDPEVDELVCSTTIVHNQYVVTSLNFESPKIKHVAPEQTCQSCC
jgi:ESCRT-I complex subunit TSG101